MRPFDDVIPQFWKLVSHIGSPEGAPAVMTAAAVLGGLLVFAQFDANDGVPLAPYRLTASLAQAESCRSATCTVSAVAAPDVELNIVRQASYQAPATSVLRPAAGEVVLGTDAAPFEWATRPDPEYRSHPGSYALAGRAPAGASRAAALASPLVLDVPTLGYVRAATAVGATGAVTLAQSQAGLAPGAALAELLFQPFDTSMAFDIADAAELTLAPGSRVAIYPDGAPALAVPNGAYSAEQLATFEPARLVAFERTASGAHIVLLLDEMRAARLVRQRVQHERAGLGPAFPDRIGLVFSPPESFYPWSGLRVPSSAIHGEGAPAWIWTVLEQLAVPLRVRVVAHSGADSVVAEERSGGATGLPISPAHWRAMSRSARATLARAGVGSARSLNRLMARSTLVVTQSNPGLRPGQVVRIDNDNQ